MFRMKRTLCASLVLLLGMLLSPLPATAGEFGERPSAAMSWEGLWTDLLDWLGLEMSSPYIDPNGSQGSESSPYIDPLGLTAAGSSAMVDPDGQGTVSLESSPHIDPDGKP